MMSTISYKDIVKLIHPDHNPNIDDAGGKMRDARLWRKDESILYRLGVQWGVINPTPKPTPKPTPRPTIRPAPRTVRPTPRRRTVRPTPRPTPTTNGPQSASSWEQAEADKKKKQNDEWFSFRVRNRIFQKGDTIYVRTRKESFVVEKTTDKRVYFMVDGKITFSLKKNVRHTR